MERPSNTTIALLAGVAALILVIAVYALTRNADQDRIGDTATASAADPDLNRACSGQPIYQQIKRALFRQAAQMRGKDADAYERIAAVASVRMENPAAEGESRDSGLVDCAGSLAIDLPPGVTTVAGRHQLMTDIYYTVDPAGEQRVVQLRGADAIVNELAGLTVGAVRAAPPVLIPNDPANVVDPLAPVPEPTVAPPPPPTGNARPSFDCSRARTDSERAVCADPGLAALDRAMAAEYSRALDGAAPPQMLQLRQTRDRFLAYRDRCPNSTCIAAAYNDRIREIRDIMAGRWVPNR